ncbi:hypothetical protein [Sulfitobacter donghicola]|uniref:Transferrin-binding protein B C-lobe/N-lobe beta barrel domain-containing protein n=1 Tax=Sulfitobacter donghicola DSW-25 = KCTC 12864 = JCM 14565 TaxID=1300350 RepID=A0A073ILC3_9RHOB|nr:hypothetical protein [Sulfitobacter donghicola]KEJ90311.1 hypothetical protein DSW25_06285 [Sulfitobacter donghicola DSW-25 = KCTC 12864 = JCM 14565]KIN67063.1 hypothetical protein Z948_768 [Sulfitobacter donghicola DSW-25 = KCTC 12864 = JCM 14565]
MNSYMFFGVLAAFGALSACSSSLGGGGSDEFDAAQILISRSAAADAAAVEDLPSEASLSGGIELNVTGQEEAVLGSMNVEADFANSTVTGSASNLGLYEISGSFGANRECLAGASCSAELVGELDGALDLSGSITGNTFDGTLAGDLSGSNAEGSVESEVDLNVDGRFLSDSEGLIASADLDGSSTNTITPTGGIGETETAGTSGVFVVAE